jgi:hypothetical protein
MTSSLPARPLTDHALWAQVVRHARCADSSLHPDAWFPVSTELGKARQEAAPAITICASCPVRSQCLELSLRHWDIGQHGVWGGLIAADRAGLRHRLLVGRRKGRRAAASGMFVPPSFAHRVLRLVKGGEAGER